MGTKIVIIFLVCNFVHCSKCIIPDLDKSVTRLIQGYGYVVETHYVMTKDGYILEVHRIPGIQGENINNRKNPVLIMHGLLCSSADWVVTGPDRSLAFLLVQNGYDVWLGNNRGNTFGKNHTHYLSTSYGFWDFSWHEFGIYDLPAMIDYILKSTKMENLAYICHSQGCSQFLVLGSLKPEYNKKIRFAASLAPATYMKHLRSMNLYIHHFVLFSKAITEKFGYFEFLASSSFLRILTSYICSAGSAFQNLCYFVIFFAAGIGTDEMDRSQLANIFAYFPAGCSWKQIIHFHTGINGAFSQFNYGSVENLRLYNSTIPPEYPVQNVKVPIAIFYGSNDFLTTPEDITFLATKLPHVVGRFLVTERKLNHLDFLFGRNIRRLVYNRILKIINAYRKH